MSTEGDPPRRPVRLTLVSRRYCHLCTQMEAALAPLAAEFGVEVEVLDVDADAELEGRYDEMVPVLLHGSHQLCHYFLAAAAVREYLQQLR